MAKKFELEKRALIEPEQLEEVISLLDKEAKLEETFRRFSIIFWDHAETAPAEASPYDFRIRITDGVGLFTLKYGDWRGGGREEYEFHFNLNELSAVVNLMRVMGNKWGTVTHVERRKYRYEGMEVVVDKYLDDGKGILEIEKDCKSEKEFEEGEKVLDEIFAKWNLAPLTKEGMVEFVVYTNNKKDNYFDLELHGVDEVISTWKRRIKA